MEDDQELDALKWKISRERGFHSHHYKDKCLRRRLAVRMRARGVESFGAYSRLLDGDPIEYERLVETLTINVSRFFRDAEAWRAMEREVLPKLFAPGAGAARVWSAGCASGEELYSLSILAREWAEAADREREVRLATLLGTDIDRSSLDAALRGEYFDLAFTETPPLLRERWFSSGPPYRLADEIRASTRFGTLDLLSDPYPDGQSLILCRNVIIYFDRGIQERVFRSFFDALNPGGYLVLGRVEALLGPIRSRFRTISTRDRIYQKPE